MRRTHVAAGTSVVVLACLAAACGTADGTGASSGSDADQSPVKAAMVAATGETGTMAPAVVVAGPLGASAQGGPDVGPVLGRADTMQQVQLLQQGDTAALMSAQATASASDPAGLVCG